MKIHPVGVELFHVDGQTGTGVTKVIVPFRNYANARKKDDLQKFRRLSCLLWNISIPKLQDAIFGSGWGYLIVTVFACDFFIVKWRRGGEDEVHVFLNLLIRRLPFLFSHRK